MAIITPPSTLRLGSIKIGQRRFDLVESSDSTGAEASRPMAPPRWTMALGSTNNMTLLQAGQWEALILQLRGRINVLAMHDPIRQAPVGTMRGAPTVSSGATAGATTFAIAGAGAGATLEAGDWLQIGSGHGTSQLVKIITQCIADGFGAMTITFEPPLRRAFVIGTALVWQRPVAYYRMQGSATTWEYEQALIFKQGGFALDLLESVETV